jgi:hypothetical protein
VSSSKNKSGSAVRPAVAVSMRGQSLIWIESPAKVFWGLQYFLSEQRERETGNTLAHQPSNLLALTAIDFQHGRARGEPFEALAARLSRPTPLAAGARGVYPPCLIACVSVPSVTVAAAVHAERKESPLMQ